MESYAISQSLPAKRRYGSLDTDQAENIQEPPPKRHGQNIFTKTKNKTDISPSASTSERVGVEPLQATSTQQTLAFATIHRVICNLSELDHNSHKRELMYFDVPRLYKGDHKAKPLRGLYPCSNFEEYVEETPHLAFIVYKNYSCNEYCQEQKDKFEKLAISGLDRDVEAQMKPYLFSLTEDVKFAEPTSESIVKLSIELQSALKVINRTHPVGGYSWDVDKDLQAPYHRVYYCRDILRSQAASSTLKNGGQPTATKVFYDYFEKEYKDDWTEAESLFKQRLVSPKHLAKLFSPNSILFSIVDHQPRGYLCKSCTVDDNDEIQLECMSWGFDGCFYKNDNNIELEWPSEDSEIDIRDLTVYPFEYASKALRKKIEKRGQLFWECRHRNFVTYLDPKQKLDGKVTTMRYMVDERTYQDMHGEQSEQDDLSQDEMKKDTPPMEPFTVLLPPTIRGFGFHDKKWRALSVEHIRAIEWNESAFDDHLVLNPNKKKLIKALVSVHISNRRSTTADIIEGKGSGLVILLHGGPGTGKTLTAETIAEHLRQPLYRVTCGDIGTEPEAVEKYLDSVLYIGTRWRSVVLLDEADVFLEERSQTDLQRNALVSVFLRVLEYYEGILILTTNRVGTFDEAFMSRVQLALHYPSLSEPDRKAIWNGFIRTLEKEVKNFDKYELDRKLDDLKVYKFNGRQIRNIVNTARQLAQHEKTRLTYSHFDQAIEVANEFNIYVEKIHGFTSEEMAKATRLRHPG